MDIKKVTEAINKSAGIEVPGLERSLTEMNEHQQGRVTTSAQLLIRETRKQVGYTQSKFAKSIKASVTSLRDWEQGRHEPPGVVTTLMEVIRRHPEVIKELG